MRVIKMTKVINTIQEWKQIRKELHGKKIGLVPTMGALHDGHISLVNNSKKNNEITVVSIFVNPTQFNDPKDLKKYPITFEDDLEKLNDAGVDYLFAPKYASMYPDDYKYMTSENSFTKMLCGKNRPGHFDGVLTIVMKLFNVIKPQNAYFGEKDYQQLILIRGMVEAYFMEVNIVPCELIREKDGLAMSSRNKLLKEDERSLAPSFYEQLNSRKPIEEIKSSLEYLGFKIDYIEEHFNHRFGAVTLGSVRLIDNVKI